MLGMRREREELVLTVVIESLPVRALVLCSSWTVSPGCVCS